MTRRRGVFFSVLLVVTSFAASPVGAAKTPATVPGAPAITGFTQGKKNVTITFTAPASNGGAAIFAYRATCKPVGGGETKLGYSRKSPTIVQALAPRKSYVCTLAARNRVGFSPPSGSIALNVAGGTSCSTASGTATFTPPLPRITDKKTVDSVLTSSGTVGKCVGGGVTSGTMTTVSLPITATNCSALARGLPSPITATATITWNTTATSTIALEIQQVKGKITQTTLTGPVTAGQFTGLHLTAVDNYALPNTACVTTELSTLTYKGITAFSIT